MNNSAVHSSCLIRAGTSGAFSRFNQGLSDNVFHVLPIETLNDQKEKVKAGVSKRKQSIFLLSIVACWPVKPQERSRAADEALKTYLTALSRQVHSWDTSVNWKVPFNSC